MAFGDGGTDGVVVLVSIHIMGEGCALRKGSFANDKFRFLVKDAENDLMSVRLKA